MIDFDAVVNGPVMAIFGEDQSGALPLYRHNGSGAGFSLKDAVYDEAFVQFESDMEGAPPITDLQPVIGVRLALFTTAPAQGDTIYLPRLSKTFMVNNVEPDGLGWAMLRLTLMGEGGL